MASLNDEIFDRGLDYATTNGTRIDICSSEPTTYAQTTSTYTLGNKTGLSTGATEDGELFQTINLTNLRLLQRLDMSYEL